MLIRSNKLTRPIWNTMQVLTQAKKHQRLLISRVGNAPHMIKTFVTGGKILRAHLKAVEETIFAIIGMTQRAVLIIIDIAADDKY